MASAISSPWKNTEKGGISFVGDDVEPVFILEVLPGFTGTKVSVALQPQVGGTAVRAGGKREKLQVVHGPRKSACAAAPGCEACDFWVKSS